MMEKLLTKDIENMDFINEDEGSLKKRVEINNKTISLLQDMLPKIIEREARARLEDIIFRLKRMNEELLRSAA